ncbi:hypothetical protein ACFV4K_22280 [Nocardia sp. NPDC059764]|uniref:hypothetical protein n=1 Tax=Nocardia sp. NPDC059764 TaxID=3346939 RepID=UPI00366938DF
MDGNKSMAQRHCIHQGVRRMVAVDNADVLELLNPFKMAPNGTLGPSSTLHNPLTSGNGQSFFICS